MTIAAAKTSKMAITIQYSTERSFVEVWTDLTVEV